MIPRDYQSRIESEVFDWFNQGGKGNPLVSAPTGSGKEYMINSFFKTILQQWPNQRLIMVCHTKELVEQNYLGFCRLCPEYAHLAGLYSAGLNRKDEGAQVLFAGIQSIAKKAYQVGWFDMAVVDEAHAISPNDETLYQRFLNDLVQINPYFRMVGYTATPFRLGYGYIYGEGKIFSEVAAEVEIPELLEKGYLSPVVSKALDISIDTSGVKKRKGEFIASQLATQLDLVMNEALDDVCVKAADRAAWIIFCPTVESAEKASDYLNKLGILTACVTGNTPKAERAELLADFKAGKYRALTNVEVLTTGFNNPAIDCVVMLRPTESTALYIQMIGRGMRIFDGKEDCLVLDYANNISTHGCVDDPIVKIPKQNREKGEAPVKICPECEEYVHASASECGGCGHIFPPPAPKIETKASDAPLLKAQIKIEFRDVDHWELKCHKKPGKPASMRVDHYASGIFPVIIASEWICFEHDGFAKKSAGLWWSRHGGEYPIPATVTEALRRQDELRTPSAIGLKRDGKYMKVSKRQFEGQAA